MGNGHWHPRVRGINQRDQHMLSGISVIGPGDQGIVSGPPTPLFIRQFTASSLSQKSLDWCPL